MAMIPEPKRLGDVVKFEDPQKLYSRDTITLVAGQNLPLGAVLGIVTASGKATQITPGAVDGSQLAAGVLIEDVDATAADVRTTMIARYAVVTDTGLVWPGISFGNKQTAIGQLAQLSGVGIIIRAGA